MLRRLTSALTSTATRSRRVLRSSPLSTRSTTHTTHTNAHLTRATRSPLLAPGSRQFLPRHQASLGLARGLSSLSSTSAASSSSSSSSSSWSRASQWTSLAVGAGLGALAASSWLASQQQEDDVRRHGSVVDRLLSSMSLVPVASACGIIGYVGPDECVDKLLEGLTILQSRGYDSAGVATVQVDGEHPERNKLVTTKHASKGTTSDCIDMVLKTAPPRHAGHHVGIAHTRWATHGGKTDENAHPHHDSNDRVALVHNGTIENADTLRAELEAQGVKFRSETDTEVIAQLIGREVDAGSSLVDAVKATVKRLEGTWGLLVMSRDDPDQLVAARNGSPLVVGVGKGRMFVASEVSAFSRYEKDFVSLHDGEVAVVSRKGMSLDLSRVEKAHHQKIELSPDPWPHWTIKEIMEQPEAVSRALNYGGRFRADGGVRLGGLDMNSEMMLNVKHLVLTGCGTSLYAGTFGALLMQWLGAFDTAQAIDASEMSYEAIPQGDHSGVLAISQSGETKDVHRVLEMAAQRGLPMFSVVNAVGSQIARTTKCGVYLNAGRENAVASTKAFTTQVTVLSLIASWFSQNRKHRHGGYDQRREALLDAVHRLPTYLGMTLRTREQCRDLAKKILDRDHMFILGKGFAYPIALEAALKVKEITYLHAEGYGGGALKHGPFALLDEGTPVVLFIFDDQHAERMRITASQVKGRGAHTIVITDNPDLAKGVADDVIVVPQNGVLTPLLGIVPMQLLAYELSVLRKCNPDKPRHLAKAVTVD